MHPGGRLPFRSGSQAMRPSGCIGLCKRVGFFCLQTIVGRLVKIRVNKIGLLGMQSNKMMNDNFARQHLLTEAGMRTIDRSLTGH